MLKLLFAAAVVIAQPSDAPESAGHNPKACSEPECCNTKALGTCTEGFNMEWSEDVCADGDGVDEASVGYFYECTYTEEESATKLAALAAVMLAASAMY